MDRASGPLRLARHLFHLASKTSTEYGLMSCNVIGYSSEAVEVEISDTNQQRTTQTDISGRKKSLFL